MSFLNTFRVVIFLTLLLAVNIFFVLEDLTTDEFLENKLLVDTAIFPSGKSIATICYIDKKSYNIVTKQNLIKESRPIIATIKERITLSTSTYWSTNVRLIMKLRMPKFLSDAQAKRSSFPW